MSMNRLTKPSAQMPPGSRTSDDRASGDADPPLIRLLLHRGHPIHVANSMPYSEFAPHIEQSYCSINVRSSGLLDFCCERSVAGDAGGAIAAPQDRTPRVSDLSGVEVVRRWCRPRRSLMARFKARP